MSTSNIPITAGDGGKQVGTYSISEDALTKQIGRTVLNDSAGAEKGVVANPVSISGSVGGAVTAVLPASQVASLTPAANITNYATESGGHLASIDAKDFSTETTLAAIKAKTDNIDVALSTRTKPADNQTVVSVSGTQHALVDNFPTVQTVQFQPSQSVNVGNLPAVTTSGVQHTLVDNYPTVQTVNVANQFITVSGVVQNVEVGSYSTATLAGSVSSLGMTVVASGVANRRIKVYAYSVQTASTTAVTAEMRDTNGSVLWTLPMQAQANSFYGSNLSVRPPSTIFKTALGAGLAINLTAAQAVIYNLSYFYDDK